LKVAVSIPVSLSEKSYKVALGTNFVADYFKNNSTSATQTAAVIVTNSTVAELWLDKVKSSIEMASTSTNVIILPDGEQFKNWDSLNAIFSALLALKAGRKTVLYALGGGVIGDITGFAAACYMRGIDFVQIPTTLLAMVDSSVGGKTAINHPLGKNMIGAFHQPKYVLADIDTLSTLPEREFKSGIAEIIKHACITDAEYFSWLEANMTALLAREASALLYAIKRSIEIKADIVAKDETEQNVRAHLNFGHTFGHAIETGLGYGKWLHGEAVAAGMVAAAHLSAQLNYIDLSVVHRIKTLIQMAGLPTELPDLPIDRYIDLMKIDKKSDAGVMKFVLLSSLGEACVRTVKVNQAELALQEALKPL
jgi:3-dehydroquinate synthase